MLSLDGWWISLTMNIINEDKPMLLKIYNSDRLIGTQFWNGIFVFKRAQETDTNYRFQFEDTRTPNVRVIWIEVNRIGHWDMQNSEWVYTLNYPNLKAQHLITAKWFEDWQNAMETFGLALKNSI
jgi:hypothetical protein